MKYDVYAKHTPVHLGVLTEAGIPYKDSTESFKCLISQIARGITDEDVIAIARRDPIRNDFGKPVGWLESHRRNRAKLSDLMGYRIKKTPKQIAELTRIAQGLFHKRGFSIQKIANETKLAKPQVKHLLGFDWSES